MNHTTFHYEYRNNADAQRAMGLQYYSTNNTSLFEKALRAHGIMFACLDYEHRTKPVYRVDFTSKDDPAPFCVVADSMYDAADWVKANIADTGWWIVNMNDR